jgi:hypothetical protein
MAAALQPSRRLVMILGAVFAATLVLGARDIAAWIRGLSGAVPPRVSPTSAPAAPAVPQAAEIAVEALGRSPGRSFAFDPAVPGRVVACDAESRDGGRTWLSLEPQPTRRAMVLGGAKAAPPAAGPEGRILCGDLILPTGGGAASGLDEIQIAAEWTGSAWRTAGLAAAPEGAETTLVEAVLYDPHGEVLAVRGDRLHTGAEAVPLPGRVEAFALDAAGRMYASIGTATRRTTLMWAAGPDLAWTEIPSPGPVRALVADGARTWAAADMLGRGSGEKWEWTRWPGQMTIDGIAARGDLVAAWGAAPYYGTHHGGLLAVSRDGGATLRYAQLERLRPTWIALDPHRIGEMLARGHDGTLSRIRLR